MLQNRVAIITGASSGIGRATAKRFASCGAKVVIAARRINELNALADEIRQAGGEVVVARGDVTDDTFSEQLVKLALDSFGQLDVGFINAGILGSGQAVTELSLTDWNQVIQTNLTSGFLAARHQIPAMMAGGGGALIFNSSFVGHTVSFPGMAAYAASKAGLVGLCQTLALEVAEHGIRVNAILPGATNTGMSRQFADTAQAQESLRQLYPLRRIASPEEIADTVLYLASDAASFTTGTALLVDGGVSISRM